MVSNAIECKLSPTLLKVAHTITVSASGRGNFTTITGALESIPVNNDKWIRIFVMPGTYNEKIKIKDKECIFVEGQSRRTTTISFDSCNDTADSTTFAVYSDNFLAKNIAFKNSYNRKARSDTDQKIAPAVAFGSFGDKHAFYGCGFEGYQDTLWDEKGHHYFKSCYIEGAVDFIWGAGQSVYEGCLINVTGEGYITAQGRNSSTDTNGYVFNYCTVLGTGHADLGRPYRAYSRVIFLNSMFTKVVNPQGWSIWCQQGHENDITFAEVNCVGPGSSAHHKHERISWMKKLKRSELGQYSTKAFIDSDGWISKLPIH
ncbi:probable pectinesterase 29 [Amaranthus tricolor]|uniref:probable pectinesterase 29 n=1 Tax=Amaranthus tricolor TaxID=29722 RepID=UPI00258A6244|nr:probable pectinesterase 29 [Amaranthus tricolor]